MQRNKSNMAKRRIAKKKHRAEKKKIMSLTTKNSNCVSTDFGVRGKLSKAVLEYAAPLS